MSDLTAKIYIGTSGWSYPKGEGTWNGHFYPKGKMNELEYYSQFFNTVEVNSSFYRPPNPAYVYNWAKRAPSNFLFAVKLWQKFTHPKMFMDATGQEAIISQDDVDVFKQSISPLMEYGKLGVLLAQFPPSFTNSDEGKQILSGLMKAFDGYSLSVELRHRSWSDDKETASLLKENNVSWVQIDEPKFKTSVAEELPITSNIAYFRFHGRNKENWWTGNAETRYKYLYNQEEIEELAGRIEANAGKSELMFAYFNNHWQGYAPRNAIDMMKSLRLSK
ncbi:MAG: DUF72 domain-containing protein [Chloroflexi bacterium]|jgi:uncharacterized protein YecE (DUF72 family)|nr:DUF72 domain-containing protein [Chloroflexota bacterium]